MKFISVRDLRGPASQLWRNLRQENDFVVTNNGKPVAILTSTDANSYERSLRDIRQSRANATLADLQRHATGRGLAKLAMDDIDAEIQASRKRRNLGCGSQLTKIPHVNFNWLF